MVEPVTLGGPHTHILSALFGPLQGYRIRYLGEGRHFSVMAETWKDGERLEAWSKEEGSPGITLRQAWNEPVRLDCKIGEPVTLWRWIRSPNSIHPQPLTEPQAEVGETVLQVTISFSN